jgi:hypothetical protein
MSRMLATEDLRVDDVPLPSRGWDDRTRDFAESFDGYEYVGGGPKEIEERLVEPLYRALDQTGRVPHAYSIEDLRAVLYWLTRYERHADWTLGVNFPAFRLFVSVVDRLRYLLLKREAAKRSTSRGVRYRCTWCGSRDIARVMYGMPAFDAELESRSSVASSRSAAA